jgi:predicted deacetylase
MFAKYIIRLDDACPTMNKKNWDRMEKLLDKHTIKPMVAIIPDNQDKKLMVDTYDNDFWSKSRRWQDKNWEIALHGYEHKYVTKGSSIVPINNYSEFSGLSLEKQKEKIKEGISIFKEEALSCRLWIAPAHSFDENTIKALKSESDISIISDGIAFDSYWEHDIHWVPQQLWRARKMPFGTWTICFHPDMMSENDFKKLEIFLEKNDTNIIAMDELVLKKRKKNIFEKLFEKVYWNLLKKKRVDKEKEEDRK